MRAELTRYAVPGWGVGELWTEADLVLAHDFDFRPVSDTDLDDGAGLSTKIVPAPGSPHDRKPQSDAVSARGEVDTKLERVSPNKNRCLTPDLVSRFVAFLNGEDVTFDDVQLDESAWTPFQQRVADVVRALPRGEVASYAEVAALAGYPRAQRAVGTFCARNRFMILVPCHRVVSADGIGSYGSAGIRVKRRLLALEGVEL